MLAPDLADLYVLPLEGAGIPYMVTGSVASMFYGEVRQTNDVDMVIHLEAASVQKFLSLFPEPEFYRPPAEVIRVEMMRDGLTGHFNVIHSSSGTKADCYPRMVAGFYAWAFAHRIRFDIGEGRGIWLAPPGYVVVRKLQYHREGGSWKHLEDIRGMIRMEAPGLDDPAFLAELKRLDLGALWEKAKAG